LIVLFFKITTINRSVMNVRLEREKREKRMMKKRLRKRIKKKKGAMSETT